MNELKNGFSNKLMERILIFSTVLSAAFTFNCILGYIFTDIPLFLVSHFIFAFVNEFLMVFILQIFMKKNTGLGFHIRLLFFFLLINYGAAYFLQEYSSPIVLLVVFLQYVFTETLFDAYISHDDFEKLCQGKTTSYLSSALAQDKYIAEDFVKNASSVKSILFALCVILVFAIFLMYIRLGHLSFLVYLFCILTILFCFANVQLFCVYDNEIYYAFLGFEKIFDTRWILFFFGLLFVTLCFVASQIFSFNYALIKYQWLIWLWNLFKKEPKPYEVKQIDVKPREVEDFDLDQNIGKIIAGTEESSHLMELIAKIVQYALIGAVVLAFIYFILKPFFNKDFSNGIKEKQLLTLIKQFFTDLKKFFAKLFGFKFELQPYASVNSRAFKLQISDLIQKSDKSKQKKLELDRLTKEFIKLIDWGDKNGVYYKKSYAPGEYTELLYSKFGYEELKHIGLIFERALYSAVLISQSEEELYKSGIEKITVVTNQ